MTYKILTPTVTFFDEQGNLDIDGNKALIDYLIENGVDGLVPLGSTGEFTNFSLEMKKELIKLYVDQVDGRVDIIAGTGAIDISECIELSNYALDLGVKGVIVIPPYYYAINDEEAYRYYDKVAKSINGNLYIYNYPARSGYDINPETVLKLAKENENIIGFKDSTSDVENTKAVIYKVLPEVPYFEVYSGFDSQFIANISSGGAGGISALSNIEPRLWSQWVQAAKDGDFKRIVSIQRKIDKLMEIYSIQSNVSLVLKKLLADKGLNVKVNAVFPFDKITEEEYNKAKEIIKMAKNIQ